MSELGGRLKEEMPIDRVVATCGECGEELFDSLKETETSPIMGGATIEMFAKNHLAKTDHIDLQVAIDKPTPVKEIEATITVNEC